MPLDTGSAVANVRDLVSRIDAVVAAAASDLRAEVERAGRNTESPIERLFIAALCADFAVRPALRARVVTSDEFGVRLRACKANGGHVLFGGDVFVVPQFVVPETTGRYRCDFAFIQKAHLTVNGTFRLFQAQALAVECDGFEWHDTSKDTFIAERKRCRALLGVGMPCVRFAGSEIWADPSACVSDALSLLAMSGGNMVVETHVPAEANGDRE